MEKKLRRSSSDWIVAGARGGIGAYRGIAPVALRMAPALFALLGKAGVPVYAFCWIRRPCDTMPGF